MATALAQLSRSGDVIVLAGEMGAGKTAFAQGFGLALGITEPITSPTFTLVHTYDSGRIVLHHADLYRLDRLGERFGFCGYKNRLLNDKDKIICEIVAKDAVSLKASFFSIQKVLEIYEKTKKQNTIKYTIKQDYSRNIKNIIETIIFKMEIHVLSIVSNGCWTCVIMCYLICP